MLDARDLGKRKAAFALLLRCDQDRAYVCEYKPGASRFDVVSCARPMEAYVAGLECWATDLRSVLRGELLPQRLLGRLRTWSFSPIALSPLHAVWRFFDFLHRPAAGEAFYNSLLAQTANSDIAIGAGENSGEVRRMKRK